MGAYMNKVREGIAQWANSENSEGSRAMEGFDALYTLFMQNDNFTQAVIDGAEKIDTNLLGFVTAEGLTQYIQELDNIAMTYGGSYTPLVSAFENNADTIIDALGSGDMNTIDIAYTTYTSETLTDDDMKSLYAQTNVTTASAGLNSEIAAVQVTETLPDLK